MKNLVLLGFLLTAFLPVGSRAIATNRHSVRIFLTTEDPLPLTISQLSEEASLLERGFDLMERESLGGWLKLGLSQREILTRLGEPSQKGKDVFWGAIGMYVQEWEYRDRGISLQMESEEPGQPKQILSIAISAPCDLKTNAGIGIGSQEETVIQAYHDYHNDFFSNDESLVAGTVYGGLIFSLENEKLS
ncbi:MAG: hypothetical protein AB4290_09180, partial [Spirulina sp.]